MRRNDNSGDRALGLHEFMRWHTVELPATKVFLDADDTNCGCLRGKVELRPLAAAVRSLGFKRVARRVERRAAASNDYLTLQEFLGWF